MLTKCSVQSFQSKNVGAKDIFDCWIVIDEYCEIWHLLNNVLQLIIAQVRSNKGSQFYIHA